VRRIHKQKTKGITKTCDKLGVRPAHPLNPILTKFGMWGGLPDVFLNEFQDDGQQMSELCGVEICLFPLTRLIAYTTACCYCTNRDTREVVGDFVLNFGCHGNGAGPGRICMTSFNRPPTRRKRHRGIFYTSGVIACFVSNFVAMATRVGRCKISLTSFDSPTPKTPC